MPGLGTSYGRGGATTFAMDLRHSDSVLIMGSNMAECHPVAFRWVMQAKTRAVNPNRLTKVWYRAPGATDWDKTKTLDWAMTEIAKRVKATRDATFRETADKDLDGNPLRDAKGNPTSKRVNHTLAIGSLGGATMDNEWNYVQAKLTRALGMVYVENQARI